MIQQNFLQLTDHKRAILVFIISENGDEARKFYSRFIHEHKGNPGGPFNQYKAPNRYDVLIITNQSLAKIYNFNQEITVRTFGEILHFQVEGKYYEQITSDDIVMGKSDTLRTVLPNIFGLYRQ